MHIDFILSSCKKGLICKLHNLGIFPPPCEMGPKTGFYKGLKQGCQHWMRVRSEKCEGLRCQPIKSRRASPKNLMSGGGGGTPTLFFSTSKFLPRFCRHIVGVPFVHHKPLTSKKKNSIFFVGREILAYQRESVRMWWNAWDSHSMRESWQLWLKTLLNIEEARLNFSFLLSCLWCKTMFRGIKKQPGIRSFEIDVVTTKISVNWISPLTLNMPKSQICTT